MPVTTYQESNLIFQFLPSWQVIKLDEHRFYRYLSGYHLRAVDFIVYNESDLFLIEVKNFSSAKTHDPEELKTKLLQKLKESIKIIEIAASYYTRKRFLLFLAPLFNRFPRLYYKYLPWIHLSRLGSIDSVKGILVLEALPIAFKQVAAWEKELSKACSTRVFIIKDVDQSDPLEKICTIKKVESSAL